MTRSSAKASENESLVPGGKGKSSRIAVGKDKPKEANPRSVLGEIGNRTYQPVRVPLKKIGVLKKNLQVKENEVRRAGKDRAVEKARFGYIEVEGLAQPVVEPVVEDRVEPITVEEFTQPENVRFYYFWNLNVVHVLKAWWAVQNDIVVADTLHALEIEKPLSSVNEEDMNVGLAQSVFPLSFMFLNAELLLLLYYLD